MLHKLFKKIPLAWLQLTHNKVCLIVAISGIAFADIELIQADLEIAKVRFAISLLPPIAP